MCPIIAASLLRFKCGCVLVVISWSFAFSTIVATYAMTPTVTIQLSPCSFVAIAVVVLGVAIIGGVTDLIFAIIPAVELQLIHDPIEFCFHLAVILINFDLQS